MRFGQFGQRDDVVVSTRNDQIDVFTPQDLEHTRAKSLGLLGRDWREEDSVKRPETWIIADARSGEQAQRFSSSLEDAENELRHLAAARKKEQGRHAMADSYVDLGHHRSTTAVCLRLEFVTLWTM